MTTLSFATQESVRRRMQAQRRRDTVPELKLRRELHRRGHRYRVERAIVPGEPRRRADIVFARARVAVFVDGCFWHGCTQHEARQPKANGWYWTAKIARNRERDSDSNARLTADGWFVVRVWEHEALDTAVERVEAALAESRAVKFTKLR